MSVVDASALVALLDAGHPGHDRARRLLAEETLVTTWGTLAEIATVARRLAKDAGRDGEPASRSAIAGLRSLQGFREAPMVALDKVASLHQEERKLSFVDAWVLQVALETAQPIASFDADLLAAWRRRR